MKITKDMTIQQVLNIDASLAPVFYGFGMFCLGCPSATAETLEQAAASHGIDINVMLEELNKMVE